jgi:hypothetical protein
MPTISVGPEAGILRSRQPILHGNLVPSVLVPAAKLPPSPRTSRARPPLQSWVRRQLRSMASCSARTADPQNYDEVRGRGAFKERGRTYELVEAAGVEPASEGTSPEDSTCVSPLEFSPPTSKRGEKPSAASSGKSHDRGPQPPAIASLLNGTRPRLAGASGRASSLFRRRVQAACSQLRWFPHSLASGVEARHASPGSTPPSKPCRPHKDGPDRATSHYTRTNSNIK